jgi:hypothetical protein
MKDKPVKIPNIGFNEALQRIAKFHKDDLPVEAKPKKESIGIKRQSDVTLPNKQHK